MKANDIKKGMKIVMKSGFEGIMADNLRGNIRLVTLEGYCGRETGSEYIHKIARVFNPETQKWEPVELSPAQQKKADATRAAGF